ncbi:hypothetical protein [Salibacterium aidingense]|uniref:hypothetical protein n=1 Tax=Salibacterium aidingense TaxID=384933 RepID=UPI00041475C4|nr:hypothetical protein [Salibacterium aidingense]
MGSTIGLILALGIIGFVFYRFQKQNQKKDRSAARVVQELFNHEKITDDGLVYMPDGTVNMLLDVQPINIKMKSPSEKDSVWFNFRSFLNSMPTHHTFLVQSQYLDMSDYIEDYVNTAHNPDIPLTPQLRESAKMVGEHLKEISERKTRDYRGYIIVRYNPYTQGTEAGVMTGNTKIDTLVEKLRGDAVKMPEDEAEELTMNMMDEIADLVYQDFDSIGCKVSRLDKMGVLNMLHYTMNRDIAAYQRLHDVYDSGGFSDTTQSLTPEISKQEHNRYDQQVAKG